MLETSNMLSKMLFLFSKKNFMPVSGLWGIDECLGEIDVFFQGVDLELEHHNHQDVLVRQGILELGGKVVSSHGTRNQVVNVYTS